MLWRDSANDSVAAEARRDERVIGVIDNGVKVEFELDVDVDEREVEVDVVVVDERVRRE